MGAARFRLRPRELAVPTPAAVCEDRAPETWLEVELSYPFQLVELFLRRIRHEHASCRAPRSIVAVVVCLTLKTNVPQRNAPPDAGWHQFVALTACVRACFRACLGLPAMGVAQR